jgi:C-terminal AAA-associated domain
MLLSSPSSLAFVALAHGAREMNQPVAQLGITPVALDPVKLLSSNPGPMVADLAVDLPQPRNGVDPKFRQLVDAIYARMTERPTGKPGREGIFPGTGIALMLPPVSPNVLAGLMEAIAGDPYNGRADLPALAASLQMEIDDLFPVPDLLHLLRLTEVADGDVSLADEGKRCELAGFDERRDCSPSTSSPTSRSPPTSSTYLTGAHPTGRTRAAFVMSSRTICQRRTPNRRCARSSRSPGKAKLLLATKAAPP